VKRKDGSYVISVTEPVPEREVKKLRKKKRVIGIIYGTSFHTLTTECAGITGIKYDEERDKYYDERHGEWIDEETAYERVEEKIKDLIEIGAPPLRISYVYRRYGGEIEMLISLVKKYCETEDEFKALWRIAVKIFESTYDTHDLKALKNIANALAKEMNIDPSIAENIAEVIYNNLEWILHGKED